jgi:hypothetical protein
MNICTVDAIIMLVLINGYTKCLCPDPQIFNSCKCDENGISGGDNEWYITYYLKLTINNVFNKI